MEKNEEYFNLINNLTSSFSEDEFYSTFISYLELGKNTVEVYRSKKNKTIDKNWVNFIEGCIIPLDNIIRNPRKFIAREEEIVPIELSKSITTESVKHLAQHTNFIAEVTEDTITPNKILNINKEESFEIYENRFIYTLLLKLKDFIDKRMDLIANSMVDNDVVNLDVKSDFTYQGRVINYDLRINTKASTDDINTENNEEMEIFERVSKLSKIVNEFCASTFSQKMRKYPLVKPPITRTNVILKNPNFKKALTLWQFIETYDKIGFDVDNVESLEDISMENYNILKNNVFIDTIMYEKLLEFSNNDNKLTKKTKYSPKFVKKFMEFVVENSDIDDVEFKKVFYDAMNKTNPIDDKTTVDINAAIDNALALDEEYLMDIQKRIEQEELERQMEIERKRKEKEAERERIRLEKEAEKARIAEEKRLEKERKEAELAEKKRIQEEKRLERERIKAEKEAKRLEELERIKNENNKILDEFTEAHKDEKEELVYKVVENNIDSTKLLDRKKLDNELNKLIELDKKAQEEKAVADLIREKETEEGIAKKKAEEEAALKAQQEAEEKARLEAEEKAKAEAEKQRIKEERAKARAEAKARALALKAEEEAKKKAQEVAGDNTADIILEEENNKPKPKTPNRGNQFLQKRTRVSNQFTDQSLAIKLLEEQEKFRSKGKELFVKQEEAKKVTYETVDGKAITVLQKGNVEQTSEEELLKRGLITQVKVTEKFKVDENGNEIVVNPNELKENKPLEEENNNSNEIVDKETKTSSEAKKESKKTTSKKKESKEEIENNSSIKNEDSKKEETKTEPKKSTKKKVVEPTNNESNKEEKEVSKETTSTPKKKTNTKKLTEPKVEEKVENKKPSSSKKQQENNNEVEKTLTKPKTTSKKTSNIDKDNKSLDENSIKKSETTKEARKTPSKTKTESKKLDEKETKVPKDTKGTN